MRSFWKIVLPVLVLLGGGAAAAALMLSKEDVNTRPPDLPPPLVRYIVVEPRTHTPVIESEGTVRPWRQTQLSAQVSGTVTWTAPNWADGAFFRAGDDLLRIEASDYQAALTLARAELARAKLALEQEIMEADVAIREWKDLRRPEDTAPALVLRKPQREEKEAAYRAAAAQVEQAELNVTRTNVRAPFDCRILHKQVDLGQYLMRGSVVATVYSTERAQVVLPIAARELPFLDLPLGRGLADANRDDALTVQLTNAISDATRLPAAAYEAPQEPPVPPDVNAWKQTWTGSIVRTRGEIDPRTRRVLAVAEVEDPFGAAHANSVPLTPGLFVKARIEGKPLHQTARLPRHALRGEDQVVVIDQESRLQLRRVTVVRKESGIVYVAAGLEPGARLCVSPLEIVVEGMRVRAEPEAQEP